MGVRVVYQGILNRDGWQCFGWTFYFESKGKTIPVDYFTGLGHCTKSVVAKSGWKRRPPLNRKVIKEDNYPVQKRTDTKTVYVHVPKIRDVLYSMANDASVAADSFEFFCANLGYDTDSRKALNSYLACQESGSKLRQVVSSRDALERILAWEL